MDKVNGKSGLIPVRDGTFKHIVKFDAENPMVKTEVSQILAVGFEQGDGGCRP